MAFDDVLARDPKSEKEFWAILEETFVQVKGALTHYPVETRDEALSGAVRGGNFKDASLAFIRYLAVREDIDSRDYFLERPAASARGQRADQSAQAEAQIR